jgi:hypothetical protein
VNYCSSRYELLYATGSGNETGYVRYSRVLLALNSPAATEHALQDRRMTTCSSKPLDFTSCQQRLRPHVRHQTPSTQLCSCFLLTLDPEASIWPLWLKAMCHTSLLCCSSTCRAAQAKQLRNAMSRHTKLLAAAYTQHACTAQQQHCACPPTCYAPVLLQHCTVPKLYQPKPTAVHACQLFDDSMLGCCWARTGPKHRAIALTATHCEGRLSTPAW